MRSCGSPVLVEESTEQVASTYRAWSILAEVSRPAGRVWWLQPERPVGTVGVVMLDVDAEDLVGAEKLIRLMRRGCTRGSRRRGDRVVGFVGWLVERAGGGRPAVALGRGSGAAGVRCSAPRNSSAP